MKHFPGLLARSLKKLFANVGLLLLVFTACLAILLSIADMVFKDRNLHFDNKVFEAIAPYYSPELTRFFQYITFFGGQKFLVPAFIAFLLFFMLHKKKRFHTWKIAVISITGVCVMFGLKSILERERPIVPLISRAHGYSFPSGHSFTSFLFFGIVAYLIYQSVRSRWLKYLLIVLLSVLVLLIGFSRVYLKVHYATDVIAGFVLAAMWLMLAKWILVDRRKKLPEVNDVAIK